MTAVTGLGAMVAAEWGDGHMGGASAWSWMALVIGLLVAFVVVAVVLLARGGERRAPMVDGARRARELLMERYARGEIDGDEFDERSRRLR